jgi:hypothetical protein
LEPYPCGVVFTGPGGVGKIAAAKALIHDLGVSEFFFSMRRALAALSGALELHRTAEVAA